MGILTFANLLLYDEQAKFDKRARLSLLDILNTKYSLVWSPTLIPKYIYFHLTQSSKVLQKKISL